LSVCWLGLHCAWPVKASAGPAVLLSDKIDAETVEMECIIQIHPIHTEAPRGLASPGQPCHAFSMAQRASRQTWPFVFVMRLAPVPSRGSICKPNTIYGRLNRSRVHRSDRSTSPRTA